MTKRPLLILLVATAGAALLWWVTQQPLAREDEPVVSAQTATPPLMLKPGATLEQTFLASGGKITGLTITSPTTAVPPPALQLTIHDEHGRELAHAYGRKLGYGKDYTSWRYELTSLVTQVAQPLILKIVHTGTKPQALIVNNEPNYPDGQLKISGQLQKADLAFTLRRPAPLPEAVRHGVWNGLALLFGGVLLTVLEYIGVGQRYRWLTAGLLLIILIPAALAGYWYSPGQWGISDWDYYLSTYEHYRRTLIQYHQFPLWNPYTCGGTAGLGDPEFAMLSFVGPPLLLWGLPDGLKIALYLSVIITALGTLVLSRRLGFSAPAAYLAAFILPLSSTVGLKLVEGHVQHLAVAWIPWVLWSWLTAYRARPGSVAARRWTVLSGLLLALMFYQGGIYMLFYLIPGLAFLSLMTAQPRRAVGMTLQAGLWSFGFSAGKLLPVLFWIRAFPDDVYHTSPNFLPHLYEIFLGRYLHGAEVLPQQGGGWHEYGAYIGFMVLALALVGASYVHRRRVVRALVLGSILIILFAAAGPFFQPLFDVIAWLPRSNVSRSLLYAVLATALLAGAGYDVLRRQLGRSAAVAFLPLLTGLAAVELASLAYPLSLQAFVLPPVVPAPAAVTGPPLFRSTYYPYRFRSEEYNRSFALARAGYGSLAYCSVLGPTPAVGLEQPLTSAQLIRWSPTAITVAAPLSGSTTIQLNTNYAPGWVVETADGRYPATNHHGLVSTTLSAGQHAVTFRYRPPGLVAGVITTSLTMLLAGYFVTTRRMSSHR